MQILQLYRELIFKFSGGGTRTLFFFRDIFFCLRFQGCGVDWCVSTSVPISSTGRHLQAGIRTVIVSFAASLYVIFVQPRSGESVAV